MPPAIAGTQNSMPTQSLNAGVPGRMPASSISAGPTMSGSISSS